MEIGVISFLGELYPFSARLHIEFDKNANSIYVSAVTPFHVKLVWRLSEFAFLCADFGWRIFIFNTGRS